MNAPHSRSFAEDRASHFARKLPTRAVEKVWGRDSLPAPFAAPEDTRIGEIWFEPPAELNSLLVKYLFTSEKLSVQVHPSRSQARAGEAGKEECWLVLDAEPGARLAIGFDEPITPNAMAIAARDGSIEGLLTWHEPEAGDLFYLPAGTVHAIGPGLSLVEVQQNSDTTFRLFDYGRPRDLHLERAIAVADGSPYPSRLRGTAAERGQTLFDAPCFRVDRIEKAPDAATIANFAEPMLALPLRGSLTFNDGGRGQSVSAGECVFASEIAALDFGDARETLLIKPQ